MADNYLEKKMEEYRSGRCSSAYRPKLTPKGKRPGQLTVEFTPCALHLASPLPAAPCDLLVSILRELAGVGFNVSVTSEDIHGGYRLARTLGCKFLPPSVTPDPDAIRLDFRPEPVPAATLSSESTTIEVSLPDLPDLMIKNVTFAAVTLANLNHSDENMLRNIKISVDSL